MLEFVRNLRRKAKKRKRTRPRPWRREGRGHSHQRVLRLLCVDGRLRRGDMPAHRHTDILAQPCAPKSGLHRLPDLEEAVLRSALADRDKSIERFGEGIKLSVNVTGTTIVTTRFLQFCRMLNEENQLGNLNLMPRNHRAGGAVLQRRVHGHIGQPQRDGRDLRH